MQRSLKQFPKQKKRNVTKINQIILVSGIDDINRQEEYIRRYIPAIVTQRTLPDNRDGLHDELKRVGLKYNDRFEYMCRTHGICGPSRLTIERQ